MTKDEVTELRRAAEERLALRSDPVPSHDEALRLLHELEVHKVELELQAEALAEARDAAQHALASAVDLYENAPLAYLTLDAAGRLRRANRAAVRLLALSADDVEGRALDSVFSADHAHDVVELVSAANEGKPPMSREVVVRSGHAGSTFVELCIERAAAADELRAVALDVTQRKRNERSLREAETMAAIGRLAAGIAHDFNNVLAIMVAHVELARRATMPPEAAESLRATLEAAERAKALTRQLLAFGRGHALSPIVIELNGFIASLATMLRRLLGGSIDLVCELSPEQPHVEIDPSHLDQIVVNLVLNARDAMPDGGQLRVTTSVERGAGNDSAVVSVQDTGTGIESDDYARIFEPFFTTKPEGRGAGLGLANVRTIVTAAGGSVAVESQRFRGTTMTVRLPLAHPRPLDVSPPTAEEPKGGTETVLLVDDEPQVLKVLARTLSLLGYTVLSAASGEEALELAERHASRIDLVISDVHMPRMSGGKLVERLRGKRPEIRAILMSGNITEEEGRVGSGDTTLLAKPFTTDEVGKALRRALAR